MKISFGFFTVLHTWSQKLRLHPHVHCVISAGGLSLDHTHWVGSRHRFFLSIKVLRRVFRGKFVAALQQAFREGQLVFHGDLTLLAQPKIFAAWLRPLFRKDWVVYSKPPFGGPQYVLQYLGRYTHRVAISNHRLVSLIEEQITFRWRDSAHHNEQKLLTLSLDEFLRRFLLHLLPEGFVRIRNFGFLANRKRATTLPLCFQLLGAAPPTEQEVSTAGPSDLWSCPKCGGPMMIVERKAYSCRDATSFSTGPGSYCRMKLVSTTRKPCVLRHAQSFCVLPLNKSLLTTSPRVYYRPFCASVSFQASGVVSLRFAAQLRRISTPCLPSIEFP